MRGYSAAEVEALIPYLSDREREELDLLLEDLPEVWNPDRILFGAQAEFVRDPAQLKDAVCSRRAGKTVGVAVELLDANMKKPDAPGLYFTLTRGSAKRIIWSTLLDLNKRYGLGYEPNESDLVLKKGGVGRIFLTGADNRSEIEKWRGSAWGKVVGDEAQALPSYLKDAVEDIFLPSFMDHNGTLTLIGTPAAVPAGFFYECTKNQEWSHHSWTVFENPWIEKKSGKTPQQHLDRMLKLRGVKVDDPSVQREWFGRWVYDPDSLVFRYAAGRNGYSSLPRLPGVWRYCIGIDVGFEDADAIAVLAWNDADRRTWLSEEHVQAKQDITSLAETIKAIWDRLGRDNVVAMVMDTGGIGKKVAEELSARHSLPVAAAQKQDKQVHIELLNDALRTGRLLVKPDGRFAHDALLVEWDREKSRPDRRVVSEKFHSDIADAVLYAFRETLAWLSKVPDQQPAPGTKEHYDAEAARLFEQTRQQVEQEKAERAEQWGGPGDGLFEGLGSMDWGV